MKIPITPQRAGGEWVDISPVAQPATVAQIAILFALETLGDISSDSPMLRGMGHSMRPSPNYFGHCFVDS